VINEGVPGNTVENLLSRINTVIALKPDLVIIMIGTNDMIDNGTFSIFGNGLKTVVDSLEHTGSHIMLLTPPPIASWSTIRYSPERLTSICSTVKLLSVSENCYFVDVNSDLNMVLNNTTSHELYRSDGLHPSGAGYEDIASYIFDYMTAQSIKTKKIVCFGDSITYGFLVTGEGTATGETYPAT
jgi:lysophospholipase L1-like esterase